MTLLDELSNCDPELIWGLLSRGLGAVFLISFASLRGQVLRTAGRGGITPIGESLAAIERHFPGWRRFVYFPSLLWIGRGDRFLQFLPWLGIGASVSLVVGGPHAPLAFAICYLVYLSLDRPMVLIYPWDCLLFEAGFWGMFLPATQLLPDVRAESAPLPAVAWVFRLMVLRLMLGFGKIKFLGTSAQDKGFLKAFFINQPLPNPIGWHAHRLPMWIHRVALALMFVIEIPLPFAVFFPGPWAALAALLLIALMLNIWLIGNFGYFNLAAIVLCLSWFDSQTALAFRFADLFSSAGPVWVHALVILHTVSALLYFPFHTFITQTWPLWPVWSRVRPRFLAWPVVLLRALHPLRWVHAYGVFPPKTPPALKCLPIIEVTWDEQSWHTLETKYSPAVETSRPRFCAPHHDRFDQAIVYEGIGLNEASILRNAMGRFDPYGHGGIPAALLFLHRIVEGTMPPDGFYDRALEQKLGPPIAARARTFIFEPTTSGELKRTGRWWRRTLVGPHFPPVRRGSGYWSRPLPEPEQWHFDDIVWVWRSQLGKLMRRAQRGESLHELVLEHAPDLTAADREELWEHFLPRACTGGTHDWADMRTRVEALRAHYGAERMNRFERLCARYALFLYARLEPDFLDSGLLPVFGVRPAKPDVKSTYHLRMLCQHIVSLGRAELDRVVAAPGLAEDYVAQLSMQSGNFFQALFRYEALVYQSQKLRLLDVYANHQGRPELTEKQRKSLERNQALARRVIGSIEVAEFLRTQFTSERDVLDVPESWPRFLLTQEGEVQRLSPEPSASVLQ